MIFRPKIFISSTFKENENIRNRIRSYFYSVGAEPLLYEQELTPSITPMTYRKNVLDANFMILIIKNYYGQKTEYGISGIHEEYKIAINNNIPTHVYIKKFNNNKAYENNPLVEELKKDGISYHYFNNDNDLMKHIKETTFTIASEIMINQIEKNKIPESSIKKLAGNLDYINSIKIISIIESMMDTSKRLNLDYIYTDLFTTCLEEIYIRFYSSHHNFINWKIDELLNNMFKASNRFIKHSGIDFTSIGNSMEFNINILGKVQITKLTYNKCSEWKITDYQKCLENFFCSFEKFKALIKNIKLEVDIL